MFDKEKYLMITDSPMYLKSTEACKDERRKGEIL
jgi:hypothetical protein